MFVILVLKQKELSKEIGSSLEANLIINLSRDLFEFQKMLIFLNYVSPLQQLYKIQIQKK